ncbi:hypothetical protein BG015_001145 [Linnemannia schmuckeri]|uniref:Uncharacterized protein n=1 Tax=Linnemannia schmuckeri TaxID=64567 RepID=A0A9P5VE12_9FUNG|nr:hypothetical protein BG015_001145 [Linnemannia schmuckeri]
MLHFRRFDLGEMITTAEKVVKLEKLIRARSSLTDLTCRTNDIDLVLNPLVSALKDTKRLQDLKLVLYTMPQGLRGIEERQNRMFKRLPMRMIGGASDALC